MKPLSEYQDDLDLWSHEEYHYDDKWGTESRYQVIDQEEGKRILTDCYNEATAELLAKDAKLESLLTVLETYYDIYEPDLTDFDWRKDDD